MMIEDDNLRQRLVENPFHFSAQRFSVWVNTYLYDVLLLFLLFSVFAYLLPEDQIIMIINGITSPVGFMIVSLIYVTAFLASLILALLLRNPNQYVFKRYSPISRVAPRFVGALKMMAAISLVVVWRFRDQLTNDLFVAMLLGFLFPLVTAPVFTTMQYFPEHVIQSSRRTVTIRKRITVAAALIGITIFGVIYFGGRIAGHNA